MGRVIIAVAFVALHIYALIDLVRAESASVRFVPKWLWFVLWVIPVLGPVAWLAVGRPRVGPAPGGGGGGGGVGPRPPRGPVAPDDDPEFLKRLDEQSWAARMERLRREREAAGPATAPGESSGAGSVPDPDEGPGSSPAPDEANGGGASR
jgi:hypothetical protein